MMKRGSLVMRLWLDDDGLLHGQVSDPVTDWRRPFQDQNQLWTLLTEFLTDMTPLSSGSNKSDNEEIE